MDQPPWGETSVRGNRPGSRVKRVVAPAERAAPIAYVIGPTVSATTGTALRAEGGIVRPIV